MPSFNQTLKTANIEVGVDQLQVYFKEKPYGSERENRSDKHSKDFNFVKNGKKIKRKFFESKTNGILMWMSHAK